MLCKQRNSITMKLTCFVLLVSASCNCDAFRVLLVFPNLSKSHSTLGRGYAKHLLNAGHEVTLITPFPDDTAHPKLRQIDISDNLKIFKPELFTIKVAMGNDSYSNLYTVLKAGFKLYSDYARGSVRNQNVIKFINDERNQFDVVIAEWFQSDIFAAFATVFNCPLIWSSSTEAHWAVLSLVDEATNPAYSPDMNTGALPPFTFGQRVTQLLLHLLTKAFNFLYMTPVAKDTYLNIFGPALAKRGRSLPPYEEVVYNASFVFANSHPSYGQSIRMPPNCKDVGGYWIDNEPAPLSKDIKDLMDNAKHGVIYYSMGSIWKSKDMPEGIKRGLLKVFSELKETVIWKFEEDLPNLPKNVHILKWAPQTSILAHSNCRLFITHGGVLSTTETVHFGVPVIGIPVGYDQHLNINRAVTKGFARKVTLAHDMASDLKLAIDEVINNPRYTKRAKEVSRVYHDRPLPAGKEIVHWVEHVVRTGGAPHLRSPALMLPWYQKMYLDVFALIILGVFICIYIIKLIRYLRRSKKVNETKKKQ